MSISTTFSTFILGCRLVCSWRLCYTYSKSGRILIGVFASGSSNIGTKATSHYHQKCISIFFRKLALPVSTGEEKNKMKSRRKLSWDFDHFFLIFGRLGCVYVGGRGLVPTIMSGEWNVQKLISRQIHAANHEQWRLCPSGLRLED